MTFSDNSSVHGAALTEENQADLLDIGLFLLDDPDSANMVVSPVGVAAAAGVIAEGSSDEPTGVDNVAAVGGATHQTSEEKPGDCDESPTFCRPGILHQTGIP